MTRQLWNAIESTRLYQHRLIDANQQLSNHSSEDANPNSYISSQIKTAQSFNGTLALWNQVLSDTFTKLSSVDISPQDQLRCMVFLSQYTQISPPVQTNQMLEVWNGALSVNDIDLSITGNDLPSLDGIDGSGPWGTPQTTFQTARNFAKFFASNPDKSPKDAFSKFASCFLNFHDHPFIGIDPLMVIHNGFEVGGGRKATQFSFDALSLVKLYTSHKGQSDGVNYENDFFVAQDGIDDETWSQIKFTTEDLYATALHSRNELQLGHRWLSSVDGQYLPQLYKVVNPENVQPGDVWVMRDGVTADNPLGSNGHTGFVLKALRGNDLSILTADRQTTKIEGIGTQEVHATSTKPQQKVVFLHPQYEQSIEIEWSVEGIIRNVDQNSYAFPSIFKDGLYEGE